MWLLIFACTTNFNSEGEVKMKNVFLKLVTLFISSLLVFGFVKNVASSEKSRAIKKPC